jgi:hypothetical protein
MKDPDLDSLQHEKPPKMMQIRKTVSLKGQLKEDNLLNSICETILVNYLN